jgi:hypothetical protein
VVRVLQAEGYVPRPRPLRLPGGWRAPRSTVAHAPQANSRGVTDVR